MGLNVDDLFGSFIQFYGLGQNLGARQDLRGLASAAPQRVQQQQTPAAREQMRAMEARGLPGAESMGGLKQGDYEFLGQRLGPSAPSQQLVDQMRQRERANIFENRGMFREAQGARDRLRDMQDREANRAFRDQQAKILNDIRERGMQVSEGNLGLSSARFARGMFESDRDYNQRIAQFKEAQTQFNKRMDMEELRFDQSEEKFQFDREYRLAQLAQNEKLLNARLKDFKLRAQKAPQKWQEAWNVIRNPNSDPLQLAYALGVPIEQLDDPAVWETLTAYQMRLPGAVSGSAGGLSPGGGAGFAGHTRNQAPDAMQQIQSLQREVQMLRERMKGLQGGLPNTIGIQG